MTHDIGLRDRSIRTLAWLGDGEFEREVRLRLVRRGDYSTDRLDKLRAKIVNATAQSELLAELREHLDEQEQGVVRRARNAAPRSSGRGSGGVKEYRAATGLEALVAWWLLGGLDSRFIELVVPAIEARIDALLAEER